MHATLGGYPFTSLHASMLLVLVILLTTSQGENMILLYENNKIYSFKKLLLFLIVQHVLSMSISYFRSCTLGVLVLLLNIGVQISLLLLSNILLNTIPIRAKGSRMIERNYYLEMAIRGFFYTICLVHFLVFASALFGEISHFCIQCDSKVNLQYFIISYLLCLLVHNFYQASNILFDSVNSIPALLFSLYLYYVSSQPCCLIIQTTVRVFFVLSIIFSCVVLILFVLLKSYELLYPSIQSLQSKLAQSLVNLSSQPSTSSSHQLTLYSYKFVSFIVSTCLTSFKHLRQQTLLDHELRFGKMSPRSSVSSNQNSSGESGVDNASSINTSSTSGLTHRGKSSNSNQPRRRNSSTPFDGPGTFNSSTEDGKISLQLRKDAQLEEEEDNDVGELETDQSLSQLPVLKVALALEEAVDADVASDVLSLSSVDTPIAVDPNTGTTYYASSSNSLPYPVTRMRSVSKLIPQSPSAISPPQQQQHQLHPVSADSPPFPESPKLGSSSPSFAPPPVGGLSRSLSVSGPTITTQRSRGISSELSTNLAAAAAAASRAASAFRQASPTSPASSPLRNPRG
jgi:hypothetical protein